MFYMELIIFCEDTIDLIIRKCGWFVASFRCVRPRFRTSYLFRVFARDLHGSWRRKLRNRRRCCCLSDWKMATFLELKRMCDRQSKSNTIFHHGDTWKNICYYLSYHTILIVEMNVLKKHIIADQWSSQPWHGFLSRWVWWKCVCVCVCLCVCRPMSQTFPNPLPVRMHQLIQVDSILKKSCPQIQPISISRNHLKASIKNQVRHTKPI